MNNIRIIIAVMLCLPIFMVGCSGDSYDFIDATPAQVKGDWVGTYTNNITEAGTITATFFVEDDVLKVNYDIDEGRITGTSDVIINVRVITFYGIGTDLVKFEGSLDAPSTGLFGNITLDYGTNGVHSGNCEMGKI